jgi:hypothetical protein
VVSAALVVMVELQVAAVLERMVTARPVVLEPRALTHSSEVYLVVRLHHLLQAPILQAYLQLLEVLVWQVALVAQQVLVARAEVPVVLVQQVRLVHCSTRVELLVTQ